MSSLTKRLLVCNATFFQCALAWGLQMEAQPSIFDLSLEDLLQIEVSSATLTPKSLKSAPSSITVVTREQLSKMPYHYLHEVLNHIPGYQSFRQAEAGDEYYHSVRGRRVGTASREVLILLDGNRINREADNAVGIPAISLDNIEKIELIRGPGSALYGSNAFMGVISITSRQGSKRFAMNASDKGAFRVSGAFAHETGDWSVDGYALAENDPGEKYQLENNFTHLQQQSDDSSHKLDLTMNLSRGDFNLNVARFERQADHFYVVENLDERNRTRNTMSYVTVSQGFNPNANWSMTLRASASRAHYQPETVLAPAGFVELYGGSDPPSDEPWEANAEQVEAAQTLTMLNDWTLDQHQSVQVGGEFRAIQLDPVYLVSNYDFNVFPIAYIGEPFGGKTLLTAGSKSRVLGAFMQYQNSLNEQLELTLGVRHDSYSDSASATSPRAALVWQVNNHHTLKWLYGEAFRSPTTNEKLFTGNAGLIGNPFLKPEKIKTLELNWLVEHGNFGVECALYANRINDAIEQSFNDTARTFTNNPEQETFQGFEVTARWKPSASWSTEVNYSQITDLPASQFRQADQLLSAQVNYVHGAWNWYMAAHYASERAMEMSDEGLRELADYVVADTRLTFRFSDTQEISFNATNLGNSQYLTPQQGQQLNQGIPNRGREFSLSYNMAF